jgi:hypothetical protein
MTKAKIISGTKEWARKNVNCVTGCANDCRYCYARAMGVRFHRVTLDSWPQEQIREHDVEKKHRKVQGTPESGMDAMFPTTHDLTPNTLDACLTVLGRVLAPGNSILITSKPRLDCIRAVCDKYAAHSTSGSNRIMFRFTIGAIDEFILRYWDRNAPSFQERLAVLEYALRAGFRTSVSVEPLLDSDHLVQLFHTLKPFVTNSVWIGKMNKVRQRVQVITPEDQRMVEQIEAGQADEQVTAIYAALKDEPLVRWKDSFKQALALPLAEQAGEDR